MRLCFARLALLAAAVACGDQKTPAADSSIPRPPEATDTSGGLQAVKPDSSRLRGVAAPTMSADAEHAKRDSLLGIQVRVATDSADDWNKGRQPKWLLRQWARLYAAADSLTRTKGDTQPTPPPEPQPEPPPPLNTAPVARFTSPNTCTVGKPCAFDGSASTDDKAIARYTWDCGVIPACVTGASKTLATYPHAGETRTVKLTVVDAEGLSNTMTRTVTTVDSAVTPPPPDTTTPPVDTLPKGDSLPERPRSIPDAAPKPCARSVDVTAGSNLQTAINAAQPGTCLELPMGSEFQGNFTLPDHACSGPNDWITIRTKGVTDVPGVRVTPGQAVSGQWAKITQANNQFAFSAANPSKCWQIYHLNIQRSPTYVGLVYHLVVLGMSAGDGNTSLATNPTDFIVRRNYIHGWPSATGELVRCVAINGRRQAIVDNWIDDCHASGFDSQAVEGWNGAGPFLIRNNFLAGAGENVMFGGADPADSTMIPKDITILQNHFYKDTTWKGKWSIKNGFELKDASRVWLEGNVWQPCAWVGSQVGMCIVFKSSVGGMSSTLPQGSTDITFINNRTDQSNRGLNLQGQDCTGQACISYFVNRVLAQNNLFTNIGTSNGIVGNDGWLLLTTNAPKNVWIRNNTFVGNTPNRGLAWYLSGHAGAAEWRNWKVTDNIFAGQGYYWLGADCPQPTHQAALDCMMAGQWTVTGNVVSEVDQTFWSKNPPGNTYVVAIDSLGLTSDFRAPKYPGKGANIDLLNQKTAGVVSQQGMSERATLAASLPRALGTPRKYVPTKADSAYMATQPRSDNVNTTTPAKNPPPRNR